MASNNINLNIENNECRTPLIIATKKGDAPIVKTLLSSKITKPGKHKNKILHFSHFKQIAEASLLQFLWQLKVLILSVLHCCLRTKLIQISGTFAIKASVFNKILKEVI